MSYKVIFRVDGNSEIGLGHLVRCNNFADLFAERLAAEIIFFTKDFHEANVICGKHTINLIPAELNADEEGFYLDNHFKSLKPDMIITDCQNTRMSYMKQIRSGNTLLVNFDDLGSGRSYCDVLIDANLDEKRAPEGPVTLCGPDYIVLHPLYNNLADPGKTAPQNVRNTLISMGGGDPLNLTIKVVEALRDRPEHFDVVIGPAYPHIDELRRLSNKLQGNFTFYRNLETLAPLLINADIAVIAGGITLYEAMCAGTPAIVLAQVEHQNVIAKRFAAKKAIMYPGLGQNVSKEEITAQYADLAKNQAQRQNMSELGMKLVDGRGLPRIYDYLKERLLDRG